MQENLLSDKPTNELTSIQEYFLSKWKNRCCPFCNSTNWEIPTNSQNEIALSNVQPYFGEGPGVMRLVDSAVSAKQSLVLLPVRCGTCNWIAHFDYLQIKEEISNE